MTCNMILTFTGSFILVFGYKYRSHLFHGAKISPILPLVWSFSRLIVHQQRLLEAKAFLFRDHNLLVFQPNPTVSDVYGGKDQVDLVGFSYKYSIKHNINTSLSTQDEGHVVQHNVLEVKDQVACQDTMSESLAEIHSKLLIGGDAFIK